MTYYQDWLKQCRFHPTSSRLIQQKAPSEGLLQASWFAKSFGSAFQSLEGEEILIQDFGEWNRGSGPDFKNATIQINGDFRHGDIELDLKDTDWEAHKHSTNPAFRKVILHVFFKSSSQTFFCRNDQHKQIPQIFIPTDQLQKNLPLAPLTHALAHPGRCAAPLALSSETALMNLLKQAALYRAHQKAFLFQKQGTIFNQAEVLWQALAATLGYGPNKNAMKLLAHRVPISQLVSRPACDREAILFGTAQFLHPRLYQKAPPDSQEYLQNLWKTWWKYRSQFQLSKSRHIPFSYQNIRPQNHAHRRLAALAQISIYWNPLYSRFKTALKTLETAPLVELLSNLKHPFWNNHYSLSSKYSTRSIALMGTPRIHDFLANTIYPLLLEKDPERAWKAYAQIRHSSPPLAVQIAQTRLFAHHSNSKNYTKFYWQQQALQQIYQDFCLQDHSDCQNCPFPEQFPSL